MTNKTRPQPIIPDHDVYRKIGGGAYGEVWLAQGVTGALRAVKIVWHDDFDDERGFEREFEGIKKYEPVSRDHPGLVNILHVGRGESGGEDFYYYVMELGDDVTTGREINTVEYEARTLRSDMLRADHTPLDVDFCIETGRALADGLDHLHHNGLAHRDVKPANIIFVDGKAKLADIGLVALRDQRTFVGTEGFVPPEGPGSAQADVYSLGKVLYEMATGKDRLEFPELPDDLPSGKALKRWRRLNTAICDVCEPRLSRRTIKTAGELARELERLQKGKGKILRVRRGVALGAVGVIAAAMVVWQMPKLFQSPPVEVIAPPEVVPAEIPEVFLTVTSTPLGAEVYDGDGNYLADTPLRPRKLPVGTEVEYVFRLQGYRAKSVTAIIDEEGLVVAPILEIYAPPVEGDPWEDVLGMQYKGIDSYHLSNNYVDKATWQTYQSESKDKAGSFAEVSERGQKRAVVFCDEAAASRFSDWLMNKSADGYLTPDHVMEPVIDYASNFQGLPAQIRKGKLRPFQMLVRRIPYARLLFTSQPDGADVYVNGKWRGVTPLLGEPAGTGIKVIPGLVTIEMEREGYQSESRELSLENDEIWSEPMDFVLKRSAGVVFDDREWINSLEMRMAPINGELLASVWETRVRDYQRFVRAANFNRPRVPDFPQTANHPIVYVSPDDARAFCEWLTKTERERGLIAKNHRYRLPTDREWSEMVGLPREAGDWPVERGNQPSSAYPWGVWPPQRGDGNYSDDSAVTEGAQPVAKSIQGYIDDYAYTAPVGQFEANALGLCDLGGNVHEWVEDSFTSGGQFGVTRGGGWNSYQSDNLLSAFRNPVELTGGMRGDSYGFRVVLAKETLVLPPEDPEIEVENME